MNSWLRAMWLLPLLGFSACGGGGGGTSAPPNTPPTANFAFTCVDLVCDFKSTSTDQDVGDAVLSHSWAFGDASGAGTTKDVSHTYTSAGTYSVTLRVTDKSEVTSTVVKQVTVTAPPPVVAAAPHASFTVSCLSLDCTFTDTSTYDPGSVFQSRVWDFGDNVTLTETNLASTQVTHQYSATTLTSFTAKLTVTDAAGAPSTSSQNISVAPPASTLDCVGGGASCVLNLAQASTVTATIVKHQCDAVGNQVVITSPIVETVFSDGCFDPEGVAVLVNGGNAFTANTKLEVEVRSGVSGTPNLVFPPSLRVTGDFAQGWTVTFDDGHGGSGEPDFDDLVILIKATPK